MPKITLICKECETNFEVYSYRKNAAFCSMKCHDNFRSRQVEHSCENCKSTFKVKMSKKTNTRYCSMKCRNEAFKGVNSPLFTKQIRFCRQCGEEFFDNNYDVGKYCSKNCHWESQKHEFAEKNVKFYSLPFWHKLRKECFERDNRTCQKCGSTEKLLHAHHIIPRRFDGPDELSNLISLCVSCHTVVEVETLKEYALIEYGGFYNG